MNKDQDTKDCWETPPELFAALDAEFNFLIDACATDKTTKCKYYFKNALDEWKLSSLNKFDAELIDIKNLSRAVFMNPPYSNAAPFLVRAWEFSEHRKVVCLVPSRMIHNKNIDFLFTYAEFRVPKPGLEIRFLSRRTKFIPPPGIKSSSPDFGCMLLIMHRKI